jgi:threonine-phosphate decarboxylase
MLHGHGDNGYVHTQDIRADFSSNVWYGDEPPGLKAHLFREWKRINRYPQVLAESLRGRISRHNDLPPENILVCSGATEGIYLIAHAFRSGTPHPGTSRPGTTGKSCTSGIIIPSFSEYEDACRIHDHHVRFLSWEDLSPALAMTDDLVWMGNPNNPTGAVFHKLDLLIRHNPGTTFVVDEAFIEFTDSITSVIPLINRLPNLIVLRSLTKSFAIPGLRLGYVAASPGIIERLQNVKLPWSVNAMAAEAGNYIFDQYDSLRLPLEELLRDKAAFVRELEEIPIKVHPGSTHFFLCETPGGTAAGLQRYLLDHYRLLIRDAGNFRGLEPKHFRLATLAPDKNQLLVSAVKEWKER